MAILSESRLREELQKKKLRSFYLFVGEDAFKQDFYTEQLAAALFADGRGAKEILYGDELEPEKLLDDARTLSLWDPQKLLVIRHGERVSAKQWELLLPLIQDPTEKCTVLIQAAKVDGRMKFFQAISKAGESVVQVKLEPAIGGEWNIWLQAFLRETGKELTNEARELLTEWNGGGSALAELKHTIHRAALYSGGQAEISREHIAAVGFKVSPEDIFRFSGGVLAGDRRAALSLLEGLLRQGEEPIALVGLLARQYRWLLGILSSRAEGKSDASISSEWGIFPGAAKVLLPASRRLGGKGVIQGLARLAEADALLKSSRLSGEHIITRLVLQLTAW